jgi:hypothetical protein
LPCSIQVIKLYKKQIKLIKKIPFECKFVNIITNKEII